MWHTVSLRDVCDISSSKRIFAKEYQTEGIPFYRGKEVIEKHKGCNVSTELFISPERYEEIKNKHAVPRKGDILLTSVGTLGVPWLVDEEDFYFKDGNLTWLRCNAEILPSYLYHWFNSAEAQNQIDSKCIGSTQKALTIETLNKFQITLPALEMQKRIISIIEPIELKISNNREINENLEQQIEAVLLSFIENTNSNPVKLDDYLYIKGRIGWKGLKKNEYLEHSDYRIINGESLTKAGIDWSKAGYISQARYDESPEIMLQNDDILLSKDGTIGKIGYIDSLSIPTTVASGIFVIRNLQPNVISTTFIYYLLKSRLFTAFIAARTEGSVIPHLYQKDFMKFEFLLPNKGEMEDFEALTAPMFSLIISNLNENNRLSRIRDTLLPRLMSGELDVSNIDI